jgi:hypothetical protein
MAEFTPEQEFKILERCRTSPFPSITEGVFLVVVWLVWRGNQVTGAVVLGILTAVHWWLRGVMSNIAIRGLRAPWLVTECCDSCARWGLAKMIAWWGCVATSAVAYLSR